MGLISYISLYQKELDNAKLICYNPLVDIKTAYEKISDIHGHLVKAETFRGYPAFTVLFAGITAFLFAAVQSSIRNKISDKAFIIQWLIVAGINVSIISMEILMDYFKKNSYFKKRQMIIVFLQFIPSLTAGLLVAVIFLKYQISSLNLLPGIWAILFSMGIFSMRPYLARFTGYIGLFYMIAGCCLIYIAPENMSLSPWSMGFTFGTGHIFAAYVLYLDIERYKK